MFTTFGNFFWLANWLSNWLRAWSTYLEIFFCPISGIIWTLLLLFFLFRWWGSIMSNTTFFWWSCSFSFSISTNSSSWFSAFAWWSWRDFLFLLISTGAWRIFVSLSKMFFSNVCIEELLFFWWSKSFPFFNNFRDELWLSHSWELMSVFVVFLSWELSIEFSELVSGELSFHKVFVWNKKINIMKF